MQARYGKRAMGLDRTRRKGFGVDWKRREAERALTDWRYMERSQDWMD